MAFFDANTSDSQRQVTRAVSWGTRSSYQKDSQDSGLYNGLSSQGAYRDIISVGSSQRSGSDVKDVTKFSGHLVDIKCKMREIRDILTSNMETFVAFLKDFKESQSNQSNESLLDAFNDLKQEVSEMKDSLTTKLHDDIKQQVSTVFQEFTPKQDVVIRNAMSHLEKLISDHLKRELDHLSRNLKEDGKFLVNGIQNSHNVMVQKLEAFSPQNTADFIKNQQLSLLRPLLRQVLEGVVEVLKSNHKEQINAMDEHFQNISLPPAPLPPAIRHEASVQVDRLHVSEQMVQTDDPREQVRVCNAETQVTPKTNASKNDDFRQKTNKRKALLWDSDDSNTGTSGNPVELEDSISLSSSVSTKDHDEALMEREESEDSEDSVLFWNKTSSPRRNPSKKKKSLCWDDPQIATPSPLQLDDRICVLSSTSSEGEETESEKNSSEDFWDSL